MEARIWPRRPEETGGYAMMPLKKNVPKGRPGWKPVNCPECGRECWERPEFLGIIKSQGMVALCTECALRKAAGMEG